MANYSDPVTRFYDFGNFRVDALRRTFLRDGQPVPLAPKAFEMLLALVERHGKIFSKDDLIRRVWPDTTVEENNLTVIISHLRKVVGENPNEHRYIVTIPGKGYRFVAPVNEVAQEEGGGSEAPLQRHDPLPHADEAQLQPVLRWYAHSSRVAGLGIAIGVCILVGTMALSVQIAPMPARSTHLRFCHSSLWRTA